MQINAGTGSDGLDHTTGFQSLSHRHRQITIGIGSSQNGQGIRLQTQASIGSHGQTGAGGGRRPHREVQELVGFHPGAAHEQRLITGPQADAGLRPLRLNHAAKIEQMAGRNVDRCCRTRGLDGTGAIELQTMQAPRGDSMGGLQLGRDRKIHAAGGADHLDRSTDKRLFQRCDRNAGPCPLGAQGAKPLETVVGLHLNRTGGIRGHHLGRGRGDHTPGAEVGGELRFTLHRRHRKAHLCSSLNTTREHRQFAGIQANLSTSRCHPSRADTSLNHACQIKPMLAINGNCAIGLCRTDHARCRQSQAIDCARRRKISIGLGCIRRIQRDRRGSSEITGDFGLFVDL